MYSSKITKYLTPMFFKGDKTNLLPGIEVIGLNQNSFIDPTKKLEIRNLYGRGGAYTCNYSHKCDETNEITLIQKLNISDELINQVDNFQTLEYSQSVVLKLRRKIFETKNLIFRMYLKNDLDIDFTTEYKFILVLDNSNIDFTQHQNIIKSLDESINLEFDQVTGTINKVVSADEMITDYKELLLNKGFK